MQSQLFEYEDVIIRCLIQSDLITYKALRLFSLKESQYSFSDSFNDIRAKADSFFLKEIECDWMNLETFTLGVFLKNTNDLIGFANFSRDKRYNARHKSMIHRTYIHPKHRRNNFGKKLLHAIINIASIIQELEQIHIWVLILNNKTQEFYEKVGFVSQGTIVQKDLKIKGVYVDAMYMVFYF